MEGSNLARAIATMPQPQPRSRTELGEKVRNCRTALSKRTLVLVGKNTFGLVSKTIPAVSPSSLSLYSKVSDGSGVTSCSFSSEFSTILLPPACTKVWPLPQPLTQVHGHERSR